jgi:hypothetical protein
MWMPQASGLLLPAGRNAPQLWPDPVVKIASNPKKLLLI